ncbi:MAG: glycosyltransferase [Ferruginibacter sp.]
MMTHQPLLSVCLLTYNHVAFIQEAIDSILAQDTDFYFNIIISDDGSTDGTTGIVKKNAIAHPEKIKLITHEKNVGLQQNFMDLFTSPTSKYISFLDGDDVYFDNKRLQKQVDFLEGNPGYAMVYGKGLLMDEKGNLKPYRRYPPYKSGHIFKEVLTCKFLPPMAAAVMRNDVVQEVYKTRTEPGIDFYLVAAICENNAVYFLNEPFFKYRMNAASITNAQKPFMAELFVKNMGRFATKYPEWVQEGIATEKRWQLYHHAEIHPDAKTFIALLRKFDFTALHIRQVGKCFFRMSGLMGKHKGHTA